MTDERDVPQGERFIPECWTGERLELIRDRRAYIPFGYGVQFVCRKALALNEMRLTTSRVVREFDVALGEPYDEGRLWVEWKDYMAVKIGVLELQVTNTH